MSHMVVPDFSVLDLPNTNPLYPDLPLDEKRFRGLVDQAVWLYIAANRPIDELMRLIEPMCRHIAEGGFGRHPEWVTVHYALAQGCRLVTHEHDPHNADGGPTIRVYGQEFWGGDPAEANWQPFLTNELGIQLTEPVKLNQLSTVLVPGMEVVAVPDYDPVEEVGIVRPSDQSAGFTIERYEV